MGLFMELGTVPFSAHISASGPNASLECRSLQGDELEHHRGAPSLVERACECVFRGSARWCRLLVCGIWRVRGTAILPV